VTVAATSEDAIAVSDYVDLLHLIEMPDGWKIVSAAWCPR
jgi:hypothetical protein